MTEEQKSLVQLILEFFASTPEEIKAREEKREREIQRKKLTVIEGDKK